VNARLGVVHQCMCVETTRGGSPCELIRHFCLPQFRS
jgi:hypothetical protein